MSDLTILKAKIVGVQITVLGVERLTNLISTSRHTLISYPLWPVLRKNCIRLPKPLFERLYTNGSRFSWPASAGSALHRWRAFHSRHLPLFYNRRRVTF